MIEFKKGILGWQEFYQRVFDCNEDISAVRIPRNCHDFRDIIVVTKGLTLNQVFSVCSKRFPTYSWWNNLDESITENVRNPTNDTYIVRIRGYREPDEKLSNLSALELQIKGIVVTTLLEALVWELKQQDETGEIPFYTKNATLCSGSRDSNGHVPYIDWCNKELCIYWQLPLRADPYYCPREVMI